MGKGRHRRARTAGRRHSWWVATAGFILVVVGALGLLRDADHLLDSAHAGASAPAPTTGAGTQPSKARWEPGAPRVLRVPALGISSRVVPVRAPNRVLVPPSDPQQLGWWADGAKPGAARGSAVMTGHSVHNGGGTLDELESVKRDDPIVVRTDQETFHYVIRRVRTYDKGWLDEIAADVFSQHVSGRLVLVTCAD